jgi:biopolymer transport protein ExbD
MAARARNSREEELDGSPQLQMTPMIDIVFQLLIFFMLACRFRTTEGEIQSLLPKGEGQNTFKMTKAISIAELRIKLLWCEPDSLRETRNPEVGRTVLKVGEMVFPSVTNAFGEVEPDWDALYDLVRKSREMYTPTTDHPTRPVIIDARSFVPFKHVISALNECVRAGITELKFAAPEIDF